MSSLNEQIAFFASYIETHLGIVYSKDNSYQLERRLREIATQLKFADIGELHAKAVTGITTDLKTLILDLATNNETSFFRDAGLFHAIERHILSQARWAGDQPNPLRIWSAATSTGQEVYSLAILLNAWQKSNSRRQFSFLATDYSLRVLEQAKSGIYSSLEVQRGLTPEVLQRHFHPAGPDMSLGSWVVNDELKRGINFKQLNLLDDWGATGPFDIVLCRNVLIYQSVENKKKIIENIVKKLAPEGYLLLGAAESLMGLSDNFIQIEWDRAVVYQKRPELQLAV